MIVLTLFSFASCNNNPGVSEGNGTLTVLVSEATSKLIGFNPDGDEPLAISHYGISLKDDEGTELKKTETPIALSGGSGSFTITGLVTGNYTIDATGYVKNGEAYADVATGTSGEIFVSPTTDTETTILIDTWKEGNAESVTISVVMPEDVIAADGTVAFDGNLKYCLTEIGTGTETIPEKTISLTAGQALSEGLYTLTLTDDVPPGRYILTVSFSSESAVKEYSNADAVLVYPGLPVTGSIRIDSHSVFDEDFTVTNALGEPLTVEGNGIYSAENGTFTVTLSNALTATQKIVWYADGTLFEENTGYKVADNVYTFTGVSAGEHYFVGIVYEEGKAASVGSIQLTISVTEPDFEFPSPFLYTDNGDGTCTITGENPDYPLPSRDGLTIPDEINGLKVTAIGNNAFYKCIFTGDLIIPDSVTSIGDWAFDKSGFTGTLTLPENLQSIGNYTFYDCGFTGDLVIPNSVKEISTSAFFHCTFTGTLTLPKNLQSIGNYAFEECDFTGDLIIPDTVTSIGRDAFRGCDFTGTLILSENLQTIGTYAFFNCAFTGDLIIPDGVTEIADSAFQSSGFTGSLTLPEGLQTISKSAFDGCGFTGDLVIPAGVITISSYAFKANSFTGTLTLPEGLQTIGESAFDDNDFTGSLIIPDGVTKIGFYAFRNNAFTGSLIIPASVTTISGYPFYYVGFTNIYCEAESQPSEWNANWNTKNRNGETFPVTWGYTGV